MCYQERLRKVKVNSKKEQCSIFNAQIVIDSATPVISKSVTINRSDRVIKSKVVQGKLSIVLLDGKNDFRDIQLLTCNGRLIFKKTISNREEILDVSMLSKNVYMLRISSIHSTIVKKIVIQ